MRLSTRIRCGEAYLKLSAYVLELVEDRVQQRRVERVAGFQPVAPHAVGRQLGHCLVQVTCRPGQYGVRPVVGGDGQARELVGQALHALRGGEHRDHPATRGQAAEETAALGHQLRAVLQAEHAGDAGRRILTDAVTQHHGGLEAPRLPEPRQTQLHREQSGLGIGGLPQRLFGFRAVDIENHIKQWLFENIGDRSAQRSTVSANTGSVSYSSRAMPGYWLP